MLGRAVLAVAAVLVLAWVGVLLRDVRLSSDADAQAVPGDAAQLARANDKLRSARLLNPDSALDVDRARNDLAAQRLRSGLRIAGDVVGREPENLDAWLVVLANALALRDTDRAAEAVARIRRLNPFAPLPR